MAGVYRITGNGKMQMVSSSTQYNGDKTGGEFRSWATHDPDANYFIKSSYGDLSQRNATLYNTSSIARACVNKPITYSIGDGLVFKSAINADFIGLSAKKAKAWSRRFSELLHYEKLESGWYDSQPIVAREAKITGDSIVYVLRESDDDKPFSLITVGGHEIAWNYTNDGATLGIKTDDFGRALGFYRNKSGYPYMPFKDENGLNAIQFMYPERAGQMRGYGCFYSEIAHAKGIDRVWDAIIERMGLEATQMGWFEVSDTDIAAQQQKMAAAAMANKNGSTTNNQITRAPGSQNMTPGGMYIMKNGEKMNFSDLKTPSNNFGMANEWVVKHFAMATGYAPEFILGEYSTSYTAHKGALNDVWKKIRMERQVQIRKVEDVVNMEYLKHFISTGELDVLPGFFTDYRIRRAYLSGSYLGPVPGQINPLQEINADIKANDQGILELSDIASKYGKDFWNSIDEWEEQQDRWYNASPGNKAAILQKDSSVDGESATGSDVGITDLNDTFNSYGVGVRSGAITPQTDDEKFFRSEAGLPDMSQAAVSAWEKNGGVRSPITLAQPLAEETVNPVGEPEDKDIDTEDQDD